MYLYTGYLLHVDLSTRQTSKKAVPKEWVKAYWGGWGLAVKYFYESVPANVAPFSPDNALVIMTGPFAATQVPTSSRFCLVSKSPHTGTIFESNAGGAFAPELKLAGYDGLIITGKADSLVFLQIQDGNVLIRDASTMKGKGSFETEAMLKESACSPDAKTLSIGPAGENLVTFACINTEYYRQFGRGGGGALFGSKNLKGIVCRGSGSIQVADMKAFLKKVDYYKHTSLLTNDNMWANEHGTSMLVAVTNEMGVHPTRNFTKGFNKDHAGLGSETVHNAKRGDRACTSCPLACGKFTHINGAEVEGPEYETLCLAGSNCEINDLEHVIRFNRLCDDLGLDTMASGNVIGLSMDMTEKKRFDFGLRFRDPESCLTVISEIALLSTQRGRDLAMGTRKLAKKYKSQDLATEIKGSELPAYDPRASYGMGLAYATSERGACHMRAFPLFAENPFELETITRVVVEGQNFNAIKWSMGLCDFWGTINLDIIADLLSVGLGQKVIAQELLRSGECIWNLCRLYNLKAGFTAEHDTIPQKIMTQKLENGPHKGKVLSESDFQFMLKRYYQIRDWDENGTPSVAKLAELGLARI